MKDRPPRERLIQATLDQVEAHGLPKLTVRAVAAASGMNIAAVNYYFRTKDALVEAALEGSVLHMVADSEAYLARMPDDPLGVLTELFGYYLEGALRYPRTSRAHFNGPFVDDDYSGIFPQRFTPVMLMLRDAVRAAVPGLTLREANRRVVAALSGVLFAPCFSGLYAPLGVFRTARDRREYARLLARQALQAPLSDGDPTGR